MQISGETCNECGLSGEPVPGQADVYAWVPPMPPDEALTVLSASSTRPSGNGLATSLSSVQLLPGIPALDGQATPLTNARHAATPATPDVAFIEDMVRGAIHGDTPDATVEYLPRLGAPWLQQPTAPSRTPRMLDDQRTSMKLAAMNLLTVGVGSIPGFPDKYRPVIPREVEDYLHALDQVLRILRGEHVSPMLGGKKAGLIQGWTYVVDERGGISLKPWRKGVPPVPLPTQPEDPNRCRLFPWDAGMTVVANDSELPLVFGLRIYRQIALEQKELANTGEFAVVVHMDQKHAIILRGECIGRCTDPLDSCRPRYLKASWEDDLRKDLETEESTEAPPSLAEDEPPGTLQFATSVTCECQPKE